MSVFRLYTDRAARVVVLGGDEARRNAAEEITNEHALLALARDCATPEPGGSSPVAGVTCLPIREPSSLALRVLSEFGITVEDIVAATCRVAGLTKPGSLSDDGPLPVKGEKRLRLSRGRRQAIRVETAWARLRGDNHLSTVHQLVGLFSVRGRAARQILLDLGVPDARSLKDAARSVDGEREQMHCQMHELAETDPSLQHDIASIMTGSTKDSWLMRRRIRRTWPAAGSG